MWQPDRDFIRAQIHGDVLLQIETGFGRERAVQFYPLRAPGPGVEQFVFDFDLSRENRELGCGGRFLQVDAVVDRDARLQVRDFHKRIAHVAADAFKFRGALFCRARGPALQSEKMIVSAAAPIKTISVSASGQENFRRGSSDAGFMKHVPKKVPPPTSDGHEGRLFPPEHF